MLGAADNNKRVLKSSGLQPTNTTKNTFVGLQEFYVFELSKLTIK